ncbi:MAG: rRNA maturation RNase YbeY [Pseudomonadales bacterium]|nr:rRNA maturation RNase YbeY [Pseudomonadales bacterium]
MTLSNTHAIQVFVDNACAATEVPADAVLQQWATAALAGLRQRAEIAIRIVDETESAALNRDYRQKHYATNVLSFPSELPESCEPPILGDLAICAAVVAREAQEQRKSLAAHWAHMVIHGCLHLLGFDHIEDDDAEDMEAREIAILHTLGFANPYQEQET